MKRFKRKHGWAVTAVLCAAVVCGCNVDGRYTKLHRPSDLIGAPPAKLTKSTGEVAVVEDAEIDLVESVIAHREAYRKALERLHDYYSTRGYAAKQQWASFELGGLRKVRMFRYVSDSELPSETLRARTIIPEADALFQRGQALMRAGGRGIPGVFREDRMIEAVGAFRQLIDQYPESDKIDDAAFLCGEIHGQYLEGQDPIAVKWYERAWTWDPNAQHRAKYQAAVIYDFRLNNRDRALELYHAVINNEASSAGESNFAAQRIADLTGVDRAVTAAATKPQSTQR